MKNTLTSPIKNPEGTLKITFSEKTYEKFKQGWLKTHPDAAETDVQEQYALYTQTVGTAVATLQRDLTQRYSDYVAAFYQVPHMANPKGSPEPMTFEEFQSKA